MNDLSLRLTSDLIRFVAFLFGKTWRIRLNGESALFPYPPTPVIYAIWHENILPIAFFFRKKYPSAIASPSRDGLILSRLLEKWTFTVINGSSSRGGMAAIRESVRDIGRGKSLIITPDGPRGPRREAKPGIAQIAALATVPVCVIEVRTGPAIRLKTWDHFCIPLPFTRINLTFSQSLSPLPDESTAGFADRIALRLNENSTCE